MLLGGQGLRAGVPSIAVSYQDAADFPGVSVVKNPPAKAGDTGDAGSIPREGKGNPLQYSCLVGKESDTSE